MFGRREKSVIGLKSITLMADLLAHTFLDNAPPHPYLDIDGHGALCAICGPNHPLRDRILACRSCELRYTCRSPVPWGGPSKSEIIFFGEAPGENEDLTLRPFTGMAGREWETYLFQAYLDRDDVRVSNICRCRPPGNATPTDNQVNACSKWVLAEIADCQPKLIVAMGRTAIRFFLGDVKAEDTHGQVFEWTGRVGADDSEMTIPVFTTLHPAAGLHNNREMKTIQEDFLALRQYLNGSWKRIQDEYPEPVYEILEGEDVAIFAERIKREGHVSADTEWTPDGQIWCATFCIDPGVAFLVWPKDLHYLIDALGEVEVTLHAAQADLNPLRQAGIELDPMKLGDTQVMAYILSYPQGLKALCRQFSGMEMKDYWEIVGPYDMALQLDYLDKALAVEIPPKEKGDRRNSIHQLINRALLDHGKTKGTEKEVNPRDRWRTWDDDRKAPIVGALGEYPMASLDDVPLETAKNYACRDADGTERTRRKLVLELKAWNSFKHTRLEQTMKTVRENYEPTAEWVEWS